MRDEYISRKEVETFFRSRNYCLDTEADIEYVVECLRKEIPAADVRPVWIPVTERLPETRDFVLTCFDDIQAIAYYANLSWHEAITNQVFYPTHWMPLPELPNCGADMMEADHFRDATKKADPCADCRWSPPSSFGGKPCSHCDTDDPLMSCYQRREDT